jgi:uncharacterized membrane protein YraQ (UPF0718 family)
MSISNNPTSIQGNWKAGWALDLHTIKSVPLGTTLAFCMSAVAVSLPEFMMLKQVMTFRLLAFIVTYLFIAISIMGWVFNFIYA